MKRVKLFEHFVNENKVSFSEAVLTALDPTLMTITERMKKSIAISFEEKFGREKKFTEWEVEMIKLGLIVDLFKSFQNYIYDTDTLVTIIPREGTKGIEISAVIERDGQQYDYFTSAIYAGGHNIQRLHMRYLVKTKLPKIKSGLAREYEKKYKNLTKAEVINSKIKDYEEKLKKAQEELKWAQSLSDEEKLEYSEKHRGYLRPTWQDIINNGAAGNFNNSEEEFNEFARDSDRKQIEFFNNHYIEFRGRMIKMGEDEIQRQMVKLQKYI